MITMWKIDPNRSLTLNEREWKRQRENPTPCKYGCGIGLVFMKDMIGRTIPCVARKYQFRNSTVRVMLADGSISTTGERYGWPVHECPKLAKNVNKEEEDVPLPELMPIEEQRVKYEN